MKIKNQKEDKSRAEDRTVDAVFLKLGRALASRGLRAKWWRRVKLAHRALYGLFAFVLAIFLLVVGVVGERSIFTAFFLFLPGQVWLIPLGLFLVSAFCTLDWRLFGAVMFSIGLFFLLYLDWQGPLSWRAEPSDSGVSVLTFNRGQRVGSLRPFKLEHQPDLIAMQEAGRKSTSYLKADGYSDLTYGEDIGEFMLLSRYPITDKGLVVISSGGRDREVAGWFIVQYQGQEIVIYNVHMPTPREHLKSFRRGAFLRGLNPSSEKARAYQVFWDQQIELAKGLLEHVSAETRPTLLVGDLNTPERGYIYSLFCRELQDAHEASGTGFGWTFPGTTRNPLTLFGPWLRIDHQFADSHWEIISSVAESGRQSQHLAVVASYELKASH